jgi:hypothetical protein
MYCRLNGWLPREEPSELVLTIEQYQNTGQLPVVTELVHCVRLYCLVQIQQASCFSYVENNLD